MSALLSSSFRIGLLHISGRARGLSLQVSSLTPGQHLGTALRQTRSESRPVFAVPTHRTTERGGL